MPSIDPSEALQYCGRLGPDDLIDPRTVIESSYKSSHVDRKTLQLCATVCRVLQQIVSGESADPVLSECEVVDVVPNPNAGRLCVSIIPPADVDPAEVLQRLTNAAGWMRAEVSASIRRRKTPELGFALTKRSAG